MIAGESLDYEQLGDAERIAVVYAPQSLRPRFSALLRLDAQLARIALTAREPALAQLKLAWWRDACADLGKAAGHPLAQEMAAAWPDGRECFSGLVDAWEGVAAGEAGMLPAAEGVAGARASACAAAARQAPSDGCRAAARRWTLTTLAAHAPDQAQREAMLAAARTIGTGRLPRSLRPLALLDGLARRALLRRGAVLIGDRLSPLAALRLGIFGR